MVSGGMQGILLLYLYRSIGDRVLGSERVLFYSAVVIMLGHIALAVAPGIAGVAIGLILVALRSGGLKASATAVAGSLDGPDDPDATRAPRCSAWASTSAPSSARS
jgi:dipeptide/tripeptide permease